MNIKNQRGQSLIQIVISIGIMGIVMAGFASMMSIQSKETRSLTEKLAALDLQKILTSALADGSVCQYVLNNPSVLTFNSTLVSLATPQTVIISTPLYASVSGGVPGPPIAQVLQQASSFSNTLIINSISLSITSGSGSSYIGNWVVEFDNTKTVRAIKPATISTTLIADTSTPTAARITGCMAGALAGTVTGRCNFGTATGTATNCSVLQAAPFMACAAGSTPYVFTFCKFDGSVCAWDANYWPQGICVHN